MERELAIATDAFEDFGGYCQRTGKNCAAASFRCRRSFKFDHLCALNFDQV